MYVEELSNEKEWEDFVTSAKAGTFYHSLKWKEVLQKSFPHRPFYLIIKNTDGRLVGISPGFIVDEFHNKIYYSTPYSDYGGPAIATGYIHQASFALLDFLKNPSSGGLAYAKFRITEKTLVNSLASPIGSTESIMGVMEIDLEATSTQFIWDHVFSGRRRKKFKQEERRGIQIREAQTRSDLRTFYELYSENMTYIGAHPFPYRFMENIWDILSPSHVRIWIMENREPFASKLFFKYGQKIFSAYFGLDRDRCPSGSDSYCYMTWAEMKRAEEEGFTQVSLGSTPSNPDDLYFVKKSSMGSSFHPQTVVWHPMSPFGRVLVRSRSKAALAWKTVRASLPTPLKTTLERKLAHL